MLVSDFQLLKADIFRRIKISASTPISKLVDSPAKIEPYITLKALQALKILYPALEVIDYKYHLLPAKFNSSSGTKQYFMTSILTRPEKNHPFVVYCNSDNTYITIIRPFGKNTISINNYNIFTEPKYVKYMTTIELYGLFVLFAESVAIRKHELINSDEFSLLKCKNIKQCLIKYKAIRGQKGGDPATKLKEMKRWKLYYEEKAVKFLEKYFDMLESKEYNEAYLFLKGKNSKYFGKQRLDTFFVNTKSIIGHLEIFIRIYEIMHGITEHIRASWL